MEAPSPDHSIVGSSDALRYVMFGSSRSRPPNATVLLLGETGTGKELLARAIHQRSAAAPSQLRRRQLRRPARDADRERAVRP